MIDNRKKLLCDSNILLIASQENVPDQLEELLRAKDTVRYYSAAALWEIVIKDMLGKLNAGIAPWELKQALEKNGYISIPVQDEHTLAVQMLKNIHNDPFDRIMIAQAHCEKLTLVTTDSLLKEYGVETIVIKR